MIRDRLQLKVKINGTVYLNDSLTSFRPLQAQVLFLGGLPPSVRSRRQTTISSQLAAGGSTVNILEGRNFKGVLQDIQVLSPFHQLYSMNFDVNQITHTEKLEDGFKIVCLKVTLRNDARRW